MSGNNYTLGKGEIHFGQFLPSTQTPRGERYFGNTPELSFSAEQENLDHYSSDRGIRIKDQSVVLQLDYAGSFITDNISPENLALFFLGENLKTTVTSTPVTGESHSDIEKGFSYQLGTSSTYPAGVRKISSFVLKKGATVLVSGVDYIVDTDLARFTILETSVTLTNGDDLTADYTIDASTRDRIVSKSSTIEGSMRYIAVNPAGAQIDYFMPWVKITPNGDFAVKGEEWQQLPFTIEILKKGSLEAVYMDGRAA